MDNSIGDQYLGDGVYASFDGYYIILDLRGQDNTTRIALEPEVMHSLFEYQKSLQDAVAKGIRHVNQN